MDISIRPTLLSDIEALPGIERSAGEAFLSIPELSWIASDDVMSESSHRRLVEGGASWVAEYAQKVSGFLAAEHISGDLHIWEMSVEAQMQAMGIGRQLMQWAIKHARDSSCQRVTLSTFVDVPWNAPFYASLDFKLLASSQLDDRLKSILNQEVRQGLRTEDRCVMSLVL